MESILLRMYKKTISYPEYIGTANIKTIWNILA